MNYEVKSETISDFEPGSSTGSDSEDLEEEHSPEFSTSTHWSAEERALLLASVKQYGMLNIEHLALILKTKTTQQIKEFFRRVSGAVRVDRRRKAIQSARLKFARCRINRRSGKCLKPAAAKRLWRKLLITELGEGPIDWWLKYIEEVMKGDSGAAMAAEMIPRAFSIIAQYEEHPHPSKCGGVDFREAYEYLYHMLSGVPPKSLQAETALFIQRSIKKLLQSLKDSMYLPESSEQYGEQLNFLMELPEQGKKAPLQTYGAKKRHSKTCGLLSPSLAMQRLIGQNSFNPLKVPEQLTWKPNHIAAKTPSAVRLGPYESSIDDVSVPCGLFSETNIYRGHCMTPRTLL